MEEKETSFVFYQKGDKFVVRRTMEVTYDCHEFVMWADAMRNQESVIKKNMDQINKMESAARELVKKERKEDG